MFSDVFYILDSCTLSDFVSKCVEVFQGILSAVANNEIIDNDGIEVKINIFVTIKCL